MLESRRLLNRKQLKEIVPKSDATLWRWEKAGKFPRRIQAGPNSVLWDAEAVDAWISEKINASQSASAN